MDAGSGGVASDVVMSPLFSVLSGVGAVGGHTQLCHNLHSGTTLTHFIRALRDFTLVIADC